FYAVGTAARILQSARLPKGTVRLLVEGTARVRVVEYLQTSPFFQARAEVLPEEDGTGPEALALAREVTARFGGLPLPVAAAGPQWRASGGTLEDVGQFAGRLVPQSRLPVEKQQTLLETLSPRERMQRLIDLLAQAGVGQVPGAAPE